MNTQGLTKYRPVTFWVLHPGDLCSHKCCQEILLFGAILVVFAEPCSPSWRTRRREWPSCNLQDAVLLDDSRILMIP